MACKATELKVATAGGRELVTLGSCPRCSDDCLGKEDVQVEDEATFQFQLATGKGLHLHTQHKLLLRNCSLNKEATFVFNLYWLSVCPVGSHPLAVRWSLSPRGVLGLKAL